MKINLIKQYGNLLPYSQEDKKKIDEFKDGAIYVVEINNSDKRTLQQNKSQWLWLTQIAQCLNDNNMYISETIKSEVEWSKDSVKTLIFDTVMKALYNKNSSTKLNKDEYDKLIDTIVNIFAKKGVVIPDFPNREDLENITYKKEK
jgi:hypothetical protein